MFNLLTTKQAFLNAAGTAPLSGGRLWTKVSGSNTNKTTFKTFAGGAGNENANPIPLDTRGEVPFGVFGTTGPYRLILAAPGDLTDPPTSPIWGPIDGVSGINDFVQTALEWDPTGLTPTFISSTSFSVPSDQTGLFQSRRRLRASVGAGFRYATISSSVFSSVTTVTVVNDVTASGLDASLSEVSLGKVSAINTSQPYDSARGLDIASAGTLTLPSNADRFNVTGTAPISALAGMWTGRRVYLTHAGAQALTHSAGFVLPGNVSFTTAVGDETVWEQTASTQAKLINHRSYATLGGRVLLSVSIIIATGTWTRPAGCTAIEVEVIGGGGGGGGANAVVATLGSAGAGGGGGGTARGFFTSGFGATESVIIGAGGLGGTATPGIGGAGAATFFGTGFLNAGSGQGGNVNTGAGVSFGATQGGAGGVGSTSETGEPGGAGLVMVNNVGEAGVIMSGKGGGSGTGGGGRSGVLIGTGFVAGAAGSFFGGGGAGGAIRGIGSTVGGPGAAGRCVVWEFGSA